MKICLRGQIFLLAGGHMRLDKYLKVSRVIKRRTVANEACDAGRVTINGKQAKASVEVKPGDIVEIRFGSNTCKFEVLLVKEAVRKEETALMYKIINDSAGAST
jgi:ribosomal 50S subunit-recycling heat shock protein